MVSLTSILFEMIAISLLLENTFTWFCVKGCKYVSFKNSAADLNRHLRINFIKIYKFYKACERMLNITNHYGKIREIFVYCW